MMTGRIKEIGLGGLSSTLSDRDCEDGDMQVCHNMASDGAVLRTVMEAEPIITLPAGWRGLVYIHHTSDGDVYIVTDDGDNAYYGTQQDIQVAGERMKLTELPVREGQYEMSSVGNILVVCMRYAADSDRTSDNGLHYFMYNGPEAGYKYLGRRPPDLGLEFELMYPNVSLRDVRDTEEFLGGQRVRHWQTCFFYQHLGGETQEDTWDVLKWQSVKDAVMGAMNKHVRECKEQSRFLQPFFVRYAYRLYDGSYMMQSPPVLMVPDYGQNPYFRMKSWVGDEYGIDIYGYSRPMALRCRATATEGEKKELRKWKDIITGIAVFVTPQMLSYAVDGDDLNMYSPQTAQLWKDWVENGSLDPYFLRGGTFSTEGTMDAAADDAEAVPMPASYYAVADVTSLDGIYIGKRQGAGLSPMFYDYFGGGFKKTDSVEDRVLGQYVFYELKEYDMDEACELGKRDNTGVEGWTTVRRDGGIVNLESFAQLPDGYQERSVKIPKYVHTYNARLNMANVDAEETGSMQAGVMSAYAAVAPVMRGITEHMVTMEGEMQVYVENHGTYNVVSAKFGAAGGGKGAWGFMEAMPGFFFYPHPDARYMRWHGTVYGYNGVENRKDAVDRWWKLKPHPYLYGAYYFEGFYNYLQEPWLEEQEPEEISGWRKGRFHLTNMMYTSEVENPFVFSPVGVNAIGTGTITAIKDATKAMSEGTSFGTMPMYAFCTDGIWALGLGDNGVFAAKQPVSRETLLGNAAEAAIQIDNSILFLSGRGLMEIDGGRTRLLSGKLQRRSQVMDAAALPHWSDIMEAFGGGEYLEADDFADYVKSGAKIAFDYANYRITVYRPYDEDEKKTHTAFLYDIGTKTWTTVENRIKSTIEGFPETVVNMAGSEGVTVGRFVTGGETPAGDGRCFYLTRPLKLGEGDTLKTLRTLMERGMGEGGSKYLAVWGSRDLTHWAAVGAVKGNELRRISGTPYKYFIVGGWEQMKGENCCMSGLSMETTDKYRDRMR